MSSSFKLPYFFKARKNFTSYKTLAMNYYRQKFVELYKISNIIIFSQVTCPNLRAAIYSYKGMSEV